MWLPRGVEPASAKTTAGSAPLRSDLLHPAFKGAVSRSKRAITCGGQCCWRRPSLGACQRKINVNGASCGLLRCSSRYYSVYSRHRLAVGRPWMPNTFLLLPHSASSRRARIVCAGKTAGEDFPSVLWSPVPRVCMTVECPWREPVGESGRPPLSCAVRISDGTTHSLLCRGGHSGHRTAIF